MAALPLQVMQPGGAAITLAAASGGGDTCPAGDEIFLEVLNGNAAARTVVMATPGTVSGLAIADRSVTIPAGERWHIPVPRMFARADGRCDLTYTPDAASVTIGCFKYAS
ncbi:hypothetical protein ACIBG4_40745 [Nonomuraea sp. NPDC050383]|uniref:hypothetical protein n=1 Tax=Nonomuraea sp. NPDC050383 TaxID=3364362 RepID=UPI0037AF270A